MKQEPIIRCASINDLEALEEIENACFDEERFSKLELQYLVMHAHGICLVVLYEEKVMAYISALVRANTNNVRIYSLAVHPKAQGRGYAQALIDCCKEYGYQQHKTYISLEVDVNNKAAIALYQKNGFTIHTTRPEYYPNGNDAYYMTCRLNKTELID